MSSVSLPHNAVGLLATTALAAFSRKLKGLPELSEDDLRESIFIAQKGCTSRGIGASDEQIIEAKNILKEENMRRGLKACVKRCEEFVEFLKYADESGETRVNLSFDDFNFFSQAKDVKAEDFK